jgi:hypothetical protein
MHEISQLTSSVNSSTVRGPRTRVIGISGLVGRVILLGGSDSGAAIMNLVHLDFRRKQAGWDKEYRAALLGHLAR